MMILDVRDEQPGRRRHVDDRHVAAIGEKDPRPSGGTVSVRQHHVSAQPTRDKRDRRAPTRLELSKPVIAAVEGPAVAGGMELALWCDVRVMAETAYFGVYCRRWGIPLLDGGTVRLPRLVGQGRALEIILTGRKVPAEECERIGLCEQLAPPGQARVAAERLAAEIARFPQDAVRSDLLSVYRQHGLPVRKALEREWETSVHAHASQGAIGAGRFKSGKGRRGDFRDI